MNGEAIEKAIDTSAAGKIEEVVTQPASTSPTQEVVAPKQEANVEPVEHEWDGDVNKLPPELQKWGKKAQSKLTQKAMANADLMRMGQEYQNFQTGEDWKAYQAWKNNQSSQPQPIQNVGSQSEVEEALLDPSGAKLNSLIQKRVTEQINQAAQYYGQELQQLRSTQQVTQFQQALADFADVNPAVIKLHEKGIMKPFLEEEMRSGKHKSYESMVAKAYDRANEVYEGLKADALAASQSRVAEKKNVVTQTGTTAAEADVVYVDKGRTFDEALNQALQGKKVKVKAK